MMREIQDVDDLRGMLPDEIVAVVQGLEADLAAAQVALAETREALRQVVRPNTLAAEGRAWHVHEVWEHATAILAADPAQRGAALLAVVAAAGAYKARVDEEHAVYESEDQGWGDRMTAAHGARQDAEDVLFDAINALAPRAAPSWTRPLPEGQE
jgi:hypothetical protein